MFWSVVCWTSVWLLGQGFFVGFVLEGRTLVGLVGLLSSCVASVGLGSCQRRVRAVERYASLGLRVEEHVALHGQTVVSWVNGGESEVIEGHVLH